MQPSSSLRSRSKGIRAAALSGAWASAARRLGLRLSLCVLGAAGAPGCAETTPQGAAGDPALPTAPGNGPLAGLEASAFLNEVWRIDGGAPRGFIFYPRENVRLNAECRSAAGQFVCDGARFLRSGMPVEIARRALDGRTSAGVKVCMRMGQPLVTARNSVGSEDSFCQFPDGSLVSSGALEQYKMRVIQ